MKTRNLISFSQSADAIESLDDEISKKHREIKPHETRNLKSFCNFMLSQGCSMKNFDGFFVGYSIPQIGKEFDLLRFGTNYILNIELKSELKVAKKNQKILKQMRENYYYLKFLGKPVCIFTYVENDGFYEYDSVNNDLVSVLSSKVSAFIKTQEVEETDDPDKLFIPSNYLISPFNSTNKFIDGEYFLTSAQQKIREEIKNELLINPFMFFCISANAGTGKTLLMYDIANELIKANRKVLIIHCGKLNEGHERLIASYKWDIISIREIPHTCQSLKLPKYDFIFVDESQRINIEQLNVIIEKCIDEKTPILFSFDTKQYLKTGETLDLAEYLNKAYSQIPVSLKKLTTKIRTNKNMASFINNLMEIGKSQDNLNYDGISIDYFNNITDLKTYIALLKEKGWVPITYTVSRKDIDPYDDLTTISEKNAHDVIGQEFSKVVLVMDKNFKYNGNKLVFRKSYYSARGMFYQIITRVVDELKIIVLDNPELYITLLDIKNMGK
ncbi:MAG: DUF2075 domain-containing protein [Lachnospiraceae bacterium]|nr:DUF2075 domain-containing protein [Lachnospiraceae bacterium]